MPDEIAMRREGNRLAPVDQMSEEDLVRVPLGLMVLVEIRTPRNIQQHRLAWALADKVAEACDFLHDRIDAMDWLKLKARHVRYIHNHHTGETQIIPKSIRFASLSQQAFNRVFNRMIYVTVTEIVPGLDEGALRSEIETMVGITPPASKRRRLTATKSQREPDDRKSRERSDATSGSITEGGDRGRLGRGLAKDPAPCLQANVGTAPPAGDGNHPQADISLPKTATEWVSYASNWLNNARDNNVLSTEIMLRWRDEMKLRNDCGVTEKVRDAVFKLYMEILESRQEA